MLQADKQGSEVTCLSSQISAEYAAARQGFTDLAAGTARQEVISARMERTWQLTAQLADLVGMEKAAAILVEAMEGGDVPRPPAAPS